MLGDGPQERRRTAARPSPPPTPDAGPGGPPDATQRRHPQSRTSNSARSRSPWSVTNGARLGSVDEVGPDLVPPGWYMLFVTDAEGTPSVGRWVQVRMSRKLAASAAALLVAALAMTGCSGGDGHPGRDAHRACRPTRWLQRSCTSTQTSPRPARSLVDREGRRVEAEQLRARWRDSRCPCGSPVRSRTPTPPSVMSLPLPASKGVCRRSSSTTWPRLWSTSGSAADVDAYPELGRQRRSGAGEAQGGVRRRTRRRRPGGVRLSGARAGSSGG